MSEWRRTTWGEVSTLEYGKALRGYTQTVGAARVYGTNGPVGWTDEAQSGGPGVIIGRKGAYRGVHYSSGPFWVIDTAFYLKPRVPIDLRWAYYALTAYDINSMDSGSAIPSTSRSDFYALPLLMPSLREQQAIAEILRVLDDKIAVNMSAIEMSDKIARLKYAEATRQGMRTSSVGELAEIFDGPHATPKKTIEGPWFLSISSLMNGRLLLAESAHIGDEDFATWTKRVTPRFGDTLFSYETRLGEAALMPRGLRACLGRRMALLRPRTGTFSRILLQAFLSRTFQETIRQRAIHGATVDRIPLIDLSDWPIDLPAHNSERLEDALASLDDLASARQRESETMAELRNTLLAPLMSGAMRIRDAEQVMEVTT